MTWSYVSLSMLRTIINTYNKELLSILSCPFRTPLHQLYEMGEVWGPLKIIRRQTTRFLTAIRRHHNPIITSIAIYDLWTTSPTADSWTLTSISPSNTEDPHLPVLCIFFACGDNRWQHGLCRRRPASEHRSVVKTQITLVAGGERRTRRAASRRSILEGNTSTAAGVREEQECLSTGANKSGVDIHKSDELLKVQHLLSFHGSRGKRVDERARSLELTVANVTSCLRKITFKTSLRRWELPCPTFKASHFSLTPLILQSRALLTLRCTRRSLKTCRGDPRQPLHSHNYRELPRSRLSSPTTTHTRHGRPHKRFVPEVRGHLYITSVIESTGTEGVVVEQYVKRTGQSHGRTGFGSRWGRSLIFACGNCVGRCRWSVVFLGSLLCPPLLNSGASLYSPHFTLIGSQYIDVKSLLDIPKTVTGSELTCELIAHCSIESDRLTLLATSIPQDNAGGYNAILALIVTATYACNSEPAVLLMPLASTWCGMSRDVAVYPITVPGWQAPISLGCVMLGLQFGNHRNLHVVLTYPLVPIDHSQELHQYSPGVGVGKALCEKSPSMQPVGIELTASRMQRSVLRSQRDGYTPYSLYGWNRAMNGSTCGSENLLSVSLRRQNSPGHCQGRPSFPYHDSISSCGVAQFLKEYKVYRTVCCPVPFILEYDTSLKRKHHHSSVAYATRSNFPLYFNGTVYKRPFKWRVFEPAAAVSHTNILKTAGWDRSGAEGREGGGEEWPARNEKRPWAGMNQ
ncbi:hypothetical protein PR048_019611 [Dryococelus australis]|uniref:Uncharacterized protein n=1 Tax=Dryococelus australis TaxID=614101 RepID=A0ABQ9H3Z1_9NEOP|nr:hypothetical protein PR048_019611 [Dryococelus australis]